jgi:predicted Zn-dependent protease
MIGDLYLTELFDRYLEGDLTPEDHEGVKSLIESNPVIAEKFRLSTDINRALMQDDIMQLRKHLKDIRDRNPEILEAAPMQVSRVTETPDSTNIINLDFHDSLNELNRAYSTVSHPLSQTDSEWTEDADSHSSLQFAIDKAIMQEDVMALRTRLTQFSKRFFSTKRSTPQLRKYLIYATSAAAALIMMIGGTMLFRQSSFNSTDSGFTGLFQSYEAVSVTRGTADNEDKIRNTAIELYNEGDFVQAGNLLDAIIETGEASQLIRVYAGACALQNGDPDKGIRYLSDWDPTEPTYIDAQWFLAGCYLDKNQRGSALAILEDLVKNESFKKYSYPAEKLIRKLHRQQ